ALSFSICACFFSPRIGWQQNHGEEACVMKEKPEERHHAGRIHCTNKRHRAQRGKSIRRIQKAPYTRVPVRAADNL
ncbi:MAG: hypothetical protein RSF84_08745, partial [Ruthenibacterium sp.]